ncbi:MAG: OmpA family protein [Rickettsiales bacterium]|jgi:flagellar motor protein MotB|nr:OmpA family protein [Rickettsiales bacterium]
MTRVFAFLLLFSVIASGAVFAADESGNTAFDKAVKEYKAAVKAAGERLVTQLKANDALALETTKAAEDDIEQTIAGQTAKLNGDTDATTPTNPSTTTDSDDNAENNENNESATADKKSDDKPKKKEPELTEEQSAAKIKELEANAKAMKDKENSTENKMLGAAAIGATGIGGMNLASGMAEQSADKAAEQDMAAYLATMKCDYGSGQNIRGGEKDVMLPGGNDMIPLYTEYVALVNELKETKTALNLRAGIESEAIIDKANSGLYDNAAIGKTGGAYTSLARALSDSNSADAAAWAQQKDDAKSKTNTGMITAAAGIGVGVLGNLAINTANKDGKNIFGKLVAKEKSAEINQKYAALAKGVKKLETQVQETPVLDICPGEAPGTWPNCICTESDARFSSDNGCAKCPNNQVYDTNDNCGCPTSLPVNKGGVCGAAESECKLTGPRDAAQTCACATNMKPDANNECKCTGDDVYPDGDECKKKPVIVNPQVEIVTVSLPSENLFASGQSTLSAEAQKTITKFLSQDLPAELKAAGVDTLDNVEYCIAVVGHTDRTKGKNGKFDNDKLSKDRAAAVESFLKSSGSVIKNATIKADGVGPAECTVEKGFQKASDAKCRRVDLTFYSDSCPG